MYAEVVVKTKIPSIGKSYTYSIPQELEGNALPGKEVSVPFGKKNLEGIILSLTDTKPEIDVKEVVGISPNPPLLTTQQLDLATWMSTHYIANFFEAIQGMLPKKASTRGSKNNNEKIDSLLEEDLLFTDEQADVFEKIEEICKKDLNKKILLHGVTGSGKTEIYLQLARQYIEKEKQALFMVPEVSLTPQLIERFSKRFGEDSIAVVHSYLSQGTKASVWQDIKDGKKKIVIGSRSAILSPFKSLGIIIIDECHEKGYKQDNNPKYNAIEVGEYLSHTYNIPLLLGSATPLISQYYQAKNDYFHLLTLPHSISGNLVVNKVIDLKDQNQATSYPLISKTLIDEVKNVLNKSEQCLIYFNRRGLRSAVLCRKCGSYELCPNCSMPLTIHEKRGGLILACHYCFFTKPMVQECSSCKSKLIKSIGSGTQSIKAELQAIFPAANISIMDKDTTRKKGSHGKIFDDFEKRKADILIGTQMVTKGWDISNISLTTYLLLDSDLLFPSYLTSERVYDVITQLSGRTGRGSQPSTNLIQTYNPENIILHEALQKNYDEFYQRELAVRDNLLYPPFVDLIQIVAKGEKEGSILRQLKSFKNDLEKASSRVFGEDEVQLLGPSRCFIPRIRNTYFFQVTIKVKKGPKNTNTNISKIIDILTKVKRTNGISINVNPYDLA
jgi:primosomal protein N' (replication factor Y)